jgi:hypothetical protein
LLTSPDVPTLTEEAPTHPIPPDMRVRVVGPDSATLTTTELRRLFRGRRLTPARRERLANSGRVVASCGSQIGRAHV